MFSWHKLDQINVIITHNIKVNEKKNMFEPRTDRQLNRLASVSFLLVHTVLIDFAYSYLFSSSTKTSTHYLRNNTTFCRLNNCFFCYSYSNLQGTSQTSCDFQYLSEVDSICGHNKECQSAARGVLMILRGSPGPQLGPRECAKNSCLNRAMRDIGV